jgi:DNA-binding NarL/FixJ family response regulator
MWLPTENGPSSVYVLEGPCAASGMTTAEIATAMFISTHTVSANLTRVFRKLGVRNRTELAARLDVKNDA